MWSRCTVSTTGYTAQAPFRPRATITASSRSNGTQASTSSARAGQPSRAQASATSSGPRNGYDGYGNATLRGPEDVAGVRDILRSTQRRVAIAVVAVASRLQHH